MRQPANRNEMTIPKDIEYVAKTVTSPDGGKQKGVDVLTHCKIVGLVARELCSRMPVWLADALFPPGCDLVAACHDIGKISPGFLERIYIALGKNTLGFSPELDKLAGGHWAVSQITLGALKETGKFIPEIVGRHHGFSPPPGGLPEDEKYGGKHFHEERLRVVERLKEIFRADWPTVVSDIHCDVLSGLTTVADWIGSQDAFSSSDEKTIGNDAHLNRLVCESLDLAGFVRPKIVTGLTFEDIFPPYAPYPAQQKMIDAVKTPGVYVLEAPMGVGKTEAALFAAYKALEDDRATGIYFALPTQLTSNKMVDRMNGFLDMILEKDCPRRQSLLLHGTAWLRQTVIGEDGQPGKSWFDYRKRGLLAPFAVGTVDQALMAVMNVKHGFVRTFGLAGKVVVLDEVHSYDGYTGTIIDYLVKALMEMHCTVIILSATLTQERRAKFLSSAEKSEVDSAYPLVSALPKDEKLRIFPAKSSETADVRIQLASDENMAIEEALIRAERGEQVLWIENTVDDAQGIFRIIGAKASELGLDFGLVHSRFIKKDREKNENKWVGIYGKDGREFRRLTGRILVGTQVLEQSLDIDADFLVSRICPTDMLLQRIGRLWRHRANDSLRPKQARREAWILSPEYEMAVLNEREFGKSAFVYAPYVLCRSVEVWRNLREINLPGQMRKLIESTYADRSENGLMARLKHEIEKKRDTLGRLARIGLARGGKTLPESKASTRYSEIESTEVLLIRAKRHEDGAVSLRMLDDSTLVLPKNIRSRGSNAWREKATILYQNTVSVPEKKAPTFLQNQMEFLKTYAYLGDENERPFRAALVRDGGELVGIGQQEASLEYRLRHDSDQGYIAKKTKEE